MKIAFVNQPLGHLLLPRDGRPLRSSSIGLWHYHVATRCARRARVVVYSRGTEPWRTTAEEHAGALFKGIPVDMDRRRLQWAERLRPWLSRAGAGGNPRRPYYLSPLYYGGYVLQVALDLRRERPDVIHIANFPQFASLLRPFCPGARIVLHMHCEWLTQLDASLLARHLRACDAVSACSSYLVEGIRRRFPGHAAKCHVLPNGVDLGFFTPGDGTEREGAEPEIVFASRISPEKGLHTLASAFGRILDELPAARLTLVGSLEPAPYDFIVAVDGDPLVRELGRFYRGGEGGYRRYLEGLLPPGKAERMTILPRLPQAELLPLYRRSAVFVFPSVCHEAFGMPPAEAMACGVPVVATRAGGLPEVVEDGVTGLLVQREDPEALASAILTLLRNPALARTMGEAGRRRVERLFSWDRVAELLLAQAGALAPEAEPAPAPG